MLCQRRRRKNSGIKSILKRPLSHGHHIHLNFDGVTALEFKELSEVTGRVFDMTVEFDPSECKELEIRVGADERFYTALIYDGAANTFTTDRTYSGCPRDLLSVRKMALPEQTSPVKLRVLMDKYSVEVFVNDGEKVMTSLTYGPMSAEKIFFRSTGSFHVTFHEIQEQPRQNNS